MLSASQAWKDAYPGAAAGALVVAGVANPERHPALDERRGAVELDLRTRFAGSDRAALAKLPTIQAYSAYYGRFDKTYHVLLQLESVALKGKPIPSVAALVEAMFIAELEDQLLTAGHDVAALQGTVRLDVAAGDERYTMLNGKAQTLKSGDMYMADGAGVVSSVLYGPDQRTRLARETRRAFFAVYAPPGIGPEAVRQHLDRIAAYAKLVAPEATVESLDVYEA